MVVTTFGKEVKKFAVRKQKKVDGQPVWHYVNK